VDISLIWSQGAVASRAMRLVKRRQNGRGLPSLIFACAAALYGIDALAVNKCIGADGKITYQAADCPSASKAEVIKVPTAPAFSDPNENVFNAAIARGRILTGMSAAQVRRAWGSPTKVNTSVGSYGRHEQWVYDRGGIGRSQYVYVQNGIVTSMQSPE
jgi:hypothetical protein